MERLNYLDLTKGLGIFLVVIGHVYGYDSNIFENWMFSFHMPLFFIISGCLIKYKENKDKKFKITDKIYTLILPYFIFSIPFIISNFILSQFNIDTLIWNIKYVLVFLGLGALWFLPALFIAEVGFSIIKKISNRYIVVVILIFTFLIPYNIANTDYNFFMLLISRGLIGLGFLAIGYYLFNNINNNNLSILAIILTLIINIIISRINGRVDLYNLEFNNLILYIFNAVSTTYSIIMLLKKINDIIIISFLGKNSLVIMATHQIVINIFHVININTSNYIIGFIVSILIIAIEYYIIRFVNRYIPLALGKRKKSNINYNTYTLNQ